MSLAILFYFCASACNTDTTPTQPHRNSNTHRTKNNMTNVVIQQNSCKLPMMDILMSETCWAHKKWNKIASGIKLVFYSSTVRFCVWLYVFTMVCVFTIVCDSCLGLHAKWSCAWEIWSHSVHWGSSGRETREYFATQQGNSAAWSIFH